MLKAGRKRASSIPGFDRLIKDIRGHAVDFGLDFFEVIFELVDYDELNEIAAYGGFPTRYPHWSFGMDYEQLSKGYAYGLQKIYELVINNDPCYAYLMKSNSLVDQKLVMAHVYGHSDFFKNNAWFAVTDRKMMDEMANHGNRIRRYMEQYGVDRVESFVDACLSIDNLIDPHSPYIRRRSVRKDPEPGEEHVRPTPYKIPGKSYMAGFLNPPEYIEEQKREIEREIERQKNFPEEPQRDVMLFLIEHTPRRYLEPWQRDILSIMREEAYYFAPQRMTKIMNEGWACVVADTPVFTDAGLIPMDALVAGDAETVSDGETARRVLDRNILEDQETITIRSAGGLVLTGSTNHRVMGADGQWRRLDELATGDRVRIAGGAGFFPPDEVPLTTAEREVDWAGLGASLRDHLGQFVADGSLPAAELETLQPAVARLLGLLSCPGHPAPSELEHECPLLDEAWSVGRATAQGTGLPAVILRSTLEVVRAYLRGLFAARAEVGGDGLTLTLPDARATREVQLLLLNDAIVARSRQLPGGDWELRIRDDAAKAFEARIGLEGAPGAEALAGHVAEHGDRASSWEDEIISIEPGRADVYDISVEQTRRYAAAGFVNHNSYWHSKIMTTRVLRDDEVIDYADHHAGTLATSPGQLNPYKVGIELFRDIEERWNKGQFGKEWEECDDMEQKRLWDKKLGIGREKIFEVRRIYNDLTFIDAFMTPEFCVQHKLFAFEYNKHTQEYVITSKEWRKIKQKLLFQLSNAGNPYIYVVDGNHDNRGELYLQHRHEGMDLKLDYAKEVLKNINKVWGRPCHLETVIDKRRKVLTYDGKKHGERGLA